MHVAADNLSAQSFLTNFFSFIATVVAYHYIEGHALTASLSVPSVQHTQLG